MVYVIEELSCARDVNLENSEDSYLCFRLALLHSVSYFFCIHRSSSSSLCTVFNAVSSDIDEVLSVNPSANVFVLGDFNVHYKDWLTYSGGTDRPAELFYNFSISNNLTQMIDFPTGILDCVYHGSALLDLFISFDLVFVLQWLSLHWKNTVMFLSLFPFISFILKKECFLIEMVFMVIWEMLHGRMSLNLVLLPLLPPSFLIRSWWELMYISHWKYQVKPHSLTWLSAASAAAIA